jgi:phage gp29-like protein
MAKLSPSSKNAPAPRPASRKRAADAPQTRRSALKAAARPNTRNQDIPGKNAVSEALSSPAAMGRILRPQATTRWLLPSVAALTPQYIEMILRGALMGNHVQQAELFDLMLDTWPELAACQSELIDGVMRKDLIFQPFTEDDEPPTDSAKEKCKLVSAAVKRMRAAPGADENGLDGLLRDTLDAWFRGVSVQEIDWQQVRAGTLGQILAPRATWWVHPSQYAWQDGMLGLSATVNVGGMFTSSTAAVSTTPFVENKFLVSIHKAKSGPALGGSLLRPLAWWWCASNFSSDWLLNLAQLFGIPFRWANHDINASQETVDAICNMLQNMGSAGWAAFPAGTTLEMKHESVSGDHSPQGELLDRADRYARMVILGQTQAGGHSSSKGSSKAFGVVEATVKADRIEAAGDFACEVIENQLARFILLLNYGNDDEIPHVRLLEDTDASATEASRDQILAALMPIPLSYLRQKYGIPEPQPDEETTQAPAAKASDVPVPPVDPKQEAAEPMPDDETDPKDAAADLTETLKALCAELNDALFTKQLKALASSL